MKNWGSALFPLSLMLVLTALTFWLRYATELAGADDSGKHRHDPDYIIENARLRKLDATGKLQYRLNAPELKHYPDDDSTELRQPSLISFHPTKPVITMSAERGRVSADGERVDLHDNVFIHRAASAKDPEMTVKTEQLTIFPDDEVAFTKEPVHITQGASWFTGVGLRINNIDRLYNVESRARGQFESRHTKK